jgi:hypothetical protein
VRGVKKEEKWVEDKNIHHLDKHVEKNFGNERFFIVCESGFIIVKSGDFNIETL